MGILKKIRDKTGTIHDIGDSRVDAFETELSGAARNVPYSPAVLGKANAIEKKIDDHAANVANPHGVTKEQLGLANVENKSSTQIRSEITKENVTNALGYTPIDESRIGAANGVASLDAGGRIPASQIPGGFDNIDEYDSLADFPETGEEGKIYVTKDTNLTYRWTGTQYIEISPSLALGETATTAYRGDRGKTAYDHSQVSGDSTIHHTHANKELLDSYTQTEADLANAVAKVHEHGNKAVLDGITADAVSKWDGKQDAIPCIKLKVGDDFNEVIHAKAVELGSSYLFYVSAKDSNVAAGIKNGPPGVLNSFRAECFTFWNGAAGDPYKSVIVQVVDASSQKLLVGKIIKSASFPNVKAIWIEKQDKLSKTDAEITAAVNKAHEHANKSVLDGITAGKVSAWDSKQQALTFDDAPTAGSTHPVTSGGIKTAIDAESTARENADTALGGRIDTVDARGLTVKEIDGEQVLCFE